MKFLVERGFVIKVGNPDALYHNYIPKKLMFREKQYEYLIEHFIGE
jgi:hypothetical protein